MAGLALALQLTDPSYLPVLQGLAETFAAARKAEVGDTFEVDLLRACIAQLDQGDEAQIDVKLTDLVYAMNIERSQCQRSFKTPQLWSSKIPHPVGLVLNH